MARTITKVTDDQQDTMIRLFVVAGALLFVLSGWLWFTKVYSAPSQVFWGMIENNLRTFGQTRHIQQQSSSTKLDQYIQLQLGSKNVVHEKATLTQAISETDTAKVVVETIGTPNVNLVHYKDISISGSRNKTSKDFAELVNAWGKQEDEKTRVQGSFAQATQGTFPMVYLPAKSRNVVLAFAKGQPVYKVNYESVKHERINGRSAMTATVLVNPVKYVQMIKLIDTVNGQRRLTQLNPEDYADSEPIEVTVTIDVLTRNLLKLSYGANSRQEQYQAFGAQVPVDLPKQTISQAELEHLLQQSIGSQ